MSCSITRDDPTIIKCVNKDKSIYIKNISPNPGMPAYVPVYNSLPNNCVINNINNNIMCIENTNPTLLDDHPNLLPYYISELTKSGNYYIQSVNNSSLQSTSSNIVFNNLDPKTNTIAPYCLIDKCAIADNDCSGVCITIDGSKNPYTTKGSNTSYFPELDEGSVSGKSTSGKTELSTTTSGTTTSGTTTSSTTDSGATTSGTTDSGATTSV